MKLLKIRSGLLALLLFPVSVASLFAYETNWNDPKYPSDTDEETGLTIPNSQFKVDGVMYTGYDFVTRGANGSITEAGGDNSGFNVERVYVNIRGSVKSGAFKGWGFRFTPDLARASTLRNDVDCTKIGTCTKGNDDYVLYAKYAYLDMPLLNSAAGKTALRVGLQPIPTVSPSTGGASVANMMGTWSYRYLGVQRANGIFGQYGLSSTADKGVSFIHTHDYFGIHLLFANGEGYHKSNADNLTGSSSLTSLSSGSGNSYGYDLYGNISLIPTGKERKFQIGINIPFRLQNVAGIESVETKTAYADFTDITKPEYAVYYGDKRAKTDYSYGIELDEKAVFDDFEQTFGVGYVYKKDKMGKAVLIDQDVIAGINGADLKSVSSHWSEQEDQTGHGAYVFAHAKFGNFGAFVRYMMGTSTGSLSSKLGTASSKPWVARVINADMKDGTMGNLSYTDMVNLEESQARFHSTILGVTYHASDRYQISLGAYTLRGTTTNGKELRENELENVTGLNGESDLATQLESSTYVKNSLGLQSSDTLDLNDYIGKKSYIKEIFVTMQYMF